MNALLDQIRRIAPASAKSWFREHRKRQVMAKLDAMHRRPLRVYVGCGYVRIDRWLHLDRDIKAKPDVVWDVAWGLPFEDNTVDFIYSEHFLEHLPLDLAVRFLKECHRCLHPDGILRTAMPSLDSLLASRGTPSWRTEFEFLQWPHYSGVKTHAELMNIVFRHFEHAWIYDREELQRRLSDAGFQTIRAANWGTSESQCLNGLETRTDSHLIYEAKKS